MSKWKNVVWRHPDGDLVRLIPQTEQAAEDLERCGPKIFEGLKKLGYEPVSVELSKTPDGVPIH